MIVDPPWWLMTLLEIGSGALIGLGVFWFFTWWDVRRQAKRGGQK